jgi:thioredoxin
MEHLDLKTFKEKVFNPDESTEWKFKGSLPAIIDFYADWCGPCRMVAPVLEELQKDYDGKLVVYKVNTEQAPDLAGMFGISSIPTILFIPKEGQPAISVGAMNKPGFIQAITDILKIPAA